MGEYKRGIDDGADLAGAGGDVAECSPAADEEREGAFAQAAQSAEQGVVGAVVHIQDLVAGGLFDRGVHADPGTGVAAVGQRGQVEMGVGPVQGAEYMLSGRGAVSMMWRSKPAGVRVL